MAEIKSRTLASVPEQLYAQLATEVADLADALTQVVLRVNIDAVIAHAAEVDRTAEALRVATRCATKPIEVADKLYDSDLVEVAALAEATSTSCPEPNAIAARVAELYDRLGGFIKPSLPRPRDQNT